MYFIRKEEDAEDSDSGDGRPLTGLMPPPRFSASTV